MSRLYYQQTTTSTTSSLPEARKLANKQRRQAGRERHEERKVQQKDMEWDRKWVKRFEGNGQRQGKRRDDGTRALAGRNLYNQRVACVLLARSTDIMGVGAEDEAQEEEQAQAYDAEEQLVVPQVTSGATLLAMARPAKSRRRRCPLAMSMTDGEAFEIVEVDGRLVALDEDGWEILPDENAEDSLLYSDIVRGIA